MTGSASMVSMTTEAPTIPVVAAMTVPMETTAIASPPGTRRSRMARMSSRCLATPLFSSITPMKMNMGIATSTWFSAMAPQIGSRSGRAAPC